MRSTRRVGKFNIGLPTKGLSNVSSTQRVEPVGERLFLGVGDVFFVPPNVYELCIVVLQGGSSGFRSGYNGANNTGSSRGGAGGNLVWRNHIPVFPGLRLDVTVGIGGIAPSANSDNFGVINGASSVVGDHSYVQAAANTSGGGQIMLVHTDPLIYSGGFGGPGGVTAVTNNQNGLGGASGQYIGSGRAQGTISEVMSGASPYGAGDLTPYIWGKGGVGIAADGSPDTTWEAGSGVNGFVRIMWGGGRNFPDNARKMT